MTVATEQLEKLITDVGNDVKEGLETLRGEVDAKVGAVTGTLEAQGKTLDEVEQKLASLETEGKQEWLPGLADHKDAQRYNLHRLMAFVGTGSTQHQKACALERDISDQVRKAGLMSVSDSGAGFLVPPEVLGSEFVDTLKESSVARALGARTIGGLTRAPIVIPRKTSRAVIQSKAEGEAAEPTDLKVGELRFQPKAINAYIPVTNLLLQLETSPDVEGLILQDLGEEMGLKQDVLILRGVGSDKEPLGVVNDPDVNKPNAAGGDIGYDRMANMIAEPIIQNAGRFSGFAWCFHGLIFKELIKLKDADERPLFTWDPSGPQPSRSIIGSPWQVSNQLAAVKGGAGELLYGAWSQLLVLEWGGLNVTRAEQASDGTINAFTQGYTFIKVERWFDSGLRQPKAMSVDTLVNVPA